ncbi:histone H1-like repetitive region-containing protein [Myxococcus xanthus]|uniref:Histone H1-like repetitive region-containing protein n=1 Tax=Myxococcus xanthus TaxID=34 RepID=A0A7Y4IEH6_MYXXA|nr:histone H1-like repetitive region-containing protein [Myxococcus xanthus]NOJ77807.1 histone H1-like repetitive region-containing protein [Myxococcus xanthus]NOJ84060.1 histone H1-like repetitive region-containing protein [Myxococcus xanthus]
MHEWLEALRKSVKASSAGVSPEEIRRAETECGVPFPDELTDLYQAFNGGELNGEVLLFRLHGAEGDPSVLEKTRLKLEGLPAAGLWRIGLKGQHRHLFASRKSAMVEQGDGGGPLPAWVEALDSDDWVYGTWEGEKRQMRLYRSLKDMLDVLVPPAEVESFGERTFARAMNAVLQGALSGVQVDEEDEEAAEAGEAPLGAAAEAEAAEEAEQLEEAELVDEEAEEPAVRELAYEYDDVRPSSRYEDGAGSRKARAQAQQIPLAIGGAGVLFPRSASSRVQGVKKAAAEPAPAKARPAKARPTKKAAIEAASAELPTVAAEAIAEPEAAPQKATAKVPAQTGVAKTSSATTKGATKAPARKGAAKKAATEKAPAGKAAAKKSVTAKAPARKAAAKKSVTAKAPARKGAAKKAPAQKGAAKRAGAPKSAAKKATAQKSAAKKVAAQKSAAKKSSVKKAAAQKSGAKKSAAKKGSAQKPAAKKGARGR